MIGDRDWNLLSKMMVKTMSYNLRFSFDLSFRWKIYWEPHNNHCEWDHSVSTKCRNTGVGFGFFKMPKVQGQKRGPIVVVRLHPWSHSVLNKCSRWTTYGHTELAFLQNILPFGHNIWASHCKEKLYWPSILFWLVLWTQNAVILVAFYGKLIV